MSKSGKEVHTPAPPSPPSSPSPPSPNPIGSTSQTPQTPSASTIIAGGEIPDTEENLSDVVNNAYEEFKNLQANTTQKPLEKLE